MSLLNTQAINFTLPNQNNELVSLADYQGKAVVLYFYPKNFTPGCNNQACNYRDAATEFEKLNVEVIGISNDDYESHQKFQQKFALTFNTLADETHMVSQQYGVYKEKNSFGVKKMGIERTTFILDKNHRIVQIFTKTDPKTDTDRVLNYIKEHLHD